MSVVFDDCNVMGKGLLPLLWDFLQSQVKGIHRLNNFTKMAFSIRELIRPRLACLYSYLVCSDAKTWWD